MKYDYLVVGSGLYGAVFAKEATDRGKKVLVIDKRPNVAGNIYTETVEGIHVHKYGAHIFHTNDTLFPYTTLFRSCGVQPFHQFSGGQLSRRVVLTAF